MGTHNEFMQVLAQCAGSLSEVEPGEFYHSGKKLRF